jgi:hypothetical protein
MNRSSRNSRLVLPRDQEGVFAGVLDLLPRLALCTLGEPCNILMKITESKIVLTGNIMWTAKFHSGFRGSSRYSMASRQRAHNVGILTTQMRVGNLHEDESLQKSLSLSNWQDLRLAIWTQDSHNIVGGYGIPDRQIQKYVSSGKLRDLKLTIWTEGSIHEYADKVFFGGYRIIPYKKSKLSFRVELQKGYVYQGGKGKVLTPSGEEIELDDSKKGFVIGEPAK